MKPYHFHQLLEDIQIYVCTNGPGLFEINIYNIPIWFRSISTETINSMSEVIIMDAGNNSDVSLLIL